MIKALDLSVDATKLKNVEVTELRTSVLWNTLSRAILSRDNTYT